MSRSLVWYLDLDPRWTRVAGTAKWSAWRRESEGPLDEDWTQQTFVGSPHRGWRGRVTGAARQVARRVVHTVGPRVTTVHLKTTIRSPRRHAKVLIRAVAADGRVAGLPPLSI